MACQLRYRQSDEVQERYPVNILRQIFIFTGNLMIDTDSQQDRLLTFDLLLLIQYYGSIC